MWLSKGSDFTSYIDIQHSPPPKCQGQGGIHFPETGSVVWGSDGTYHAVEELRIPEAGGPEARESGV